MPAVTSKPTPSVERAALEAELRRGMQSLPDVTPEQMQEFERSLADVQPSVLTTLREAIGGKN